MPRVVRRIGRDPEAHFVILDADSTGTAALVTTADAYLPGRPADEYDSEDLTQLDLDGVEEVENTRTVHALFTDEADGNHTRLSFWTDEDEARRELSKLHENGEWWVYLLSKEI